MQTAITPDSGFLGHFRMIGIIVTIGLTILTGAFFLDLGSNNAVPNAPLYDTQIKASIIDITVKETSPLHKGSILDREGLLVQYSFELNGKNYTQTEFVESIKTEEFEMIKNMIESSAQFIWVELDSRNPNKATIDFSKSIASS